MIHFSALTFSQTLSLFFAHSCTDFWLKAKCSYQPCEISDTARPWLLNISFIPVCVRIGIKMFYWFLFVFSVCVCVCVLFLNERDWLASLSSCLPSSYFACASNQIW